MDLDTVLAAFGKRLDALEKMLEVKPDAPPDESHIKVSIDTHELAGMLDKFKEGLAEDFKFVHDRINAVSADQVDFKQSATGVKLVDDPKAVDVVTEQPAPEGVTL